MVAFEDHFWGDKYNGFEVLLHNFKLGANASKELSEFVKERSSIEEAYFKSLLKLSNKCSSVYNHIGSFEPCWKFLQSTTEKLANAHQQVMTHLHEVTKAIKEYSEQQKEKQKQLKDDFSSTAEVVQSMQGLSNAVSKAREGYQQKSTDVEKCRKESTSIKEIEKTENKLKKVCEEYKSLIEKRETTRKEFGEKMISIAQKFQTLEEEHLKQMCDILRMYGLSLTTDRFLLDQVIEEFERNMVSFTIDSLLQQFVYAKQTGKTSPAAIEFQEIPLQVPPIDMEALAGREEEKKKKKKEKRERKERRIIRKKPKATENGTVQGPEGTPEPAFEVDEDGFQKRPEDTSSIKSGKSRDSMSFDSDSDSDDEPRKIQIKIKNKEEINSVPTADELRAFGAQLTLSSPSSLKKFPTSEKRFGGSQSSIDRTMKLSASNNGLPESGSESESVKSHPSDTSLDTLQNPSLNPTQLTIPTSTSGMDLDTMFDNSFFTLASTNADASGESGNSSIEFKVDEEMPPPLPEKKRSSSSLSQKMIAGFNFDSKPTIDWDLDNKERTTSPPAATGAFPKPPNSADANKQRSKTFKLPVLAPPSSNPRRQSTSNRQGHRPTPVSTENNISPPQITTALTPVTPVTTLTSSLKDLADIQFTPTWPTTTPAINEEPNTVSAETTSNPWVSMSEPLTTRGDTQAPNATGTASPPPVATSEKVTPIAVAFIETVNACFKGADQTKCMLKVTGDMTVSFPATVIETLTGESPPVLSFAINGTSSLEQIFPNKALVETEGQVAGGTALHFKFNVAALATYLKKQAEQGTPVAYYNIDILRYQVRTEGLNSLPLHLCAYWRCDKSHTDLKIDYKYNSACMASQAPLTGLTVVVPVDGGVEIMQSKPSATWSGEHQRALWKIPKLPGMVDGLNRDSGSLRARFDVSKGPSTPAAVGVQFSVEGTVLSHLNFEVRSPSLKLSLVKKRFASGKYIVEP